MSDGHLDPEQFQAVDESLEDDATAQRNNALGVLLGNLSPDVEGRRMGPNEKAAHVVNRIEEIAAENERLRERVSELEARIDPHPESKEYHELDRDEKVQILRESMVEMANARHNGRYAMDYNDVLLIFDGNPSPGHAYQLMELAAEADGFHYAERDGDANQIRVKLDGVNDETLFHAVNKAPEEVRP